MRGRCARQGMRALARTSEEGMPRPGTGGRLLAGTILSLVVSLGLIACESTTGPEIREGSLVELTYDGLPALDPELDGSYAGWILRNGGQVTALGSLDFQGSGSISVTVSVPDAVGLLVAVVPPDVSDHAPPEHPMLQGSFRRGEIELSYEGAVTQASLPLRERPGQFTIFAPSTGPFYRYPHHEESGIWLFNTQPRETEQGDTWLRLTPLAAGWLYEHWVVRDIDGPHPIWLSGGKFRPNQWGIVSERDDTGWGPFSGVASYEVVGTEEFPGADWFANPLDLPFPEELELPLDLTEQTTLGESRWHMVITIEPSFDQGEPLTTERPFVLRPYREPVGTGGPGEPRTIELSPELLPTVRGTVR